MKYESAYPIGAYVSFMDLDTPARGIIVAITFTRAKVFYDIVDDYHGEVISRIDSCDVRTITEPVN